MDTNSLRSIDPTDQFPPSAVINEAETGPRHPSRFESRTSSIPNTQLVRNDAVRVYRNAALTVANNDFIVWDSPIPKPQTALIYDTTGIWTGADIFTLPSTGKITGSWTIKAQVCWLGAAGGTFRQISIIRNSIPIAVKSGPSTTTDQDISDVIYDPSKSDTIQIQVAHDAGGVLSLVVGSTKTFCSIIHIG